MTQEHPITPPPELVKQWVSLACEYEGDETWIDLATEAARWGADQELEACCEQLRSLGPGQRTIDSLRAHRRPKPPSLKEQALLALSHLEKGAEPQMDATEAAYTIRRALKSLPS